MSGLLARRDDDRHLRAESRAFAAGDDAFVAYLAQLSPGAWRARKTSPADTLTLLQAAVMQDRPAAIAALWQAGGPQALPQPFDGWAGIAALALRLRKPRMAMASVDAGVLSAVDFAHHFPNAKSLWWRLVEQKKLPATRFVAHFGAEAGALAHLLRTGQLSRTACALLCKPYPKVAVCLALQGLLPPAYLFASGMTPSQRHALGLCCLQSNLPIPADLMRQAPALRAEAFTRAQRGQLTVDAFLRYVPRPGQKNLATLAQYAVVSETQWLRAGALSAPSLQTLCHQGKLTAPQAIKLGPVPDDVGHKFLDSNQIALAEYITASMSVWDPDDALAQVLVAWATAAPSPSALFAQLPQNRDAEARKSLAARLLAAHALGHLALADAAASQQASQCTVCGDAFGVDNPGVAPSGCEHAADFCTSCMRRTLYHDPQRQTCPHQGCSRPLTPNDVIACGGGAMAADNLARAVVRCRLALPLDWVACATKGCVGGARCAPYARGQIGQACPVCAQTLASSAQWLDTHGDVAKVARLICNLRGGDDEEATLIRECYHCGTPTELASGCNLIRCRMCSKQWNFRRGKKNSSVDYCKRAQTYVPHRGLLLEAGLYAGFSPGQLEVSDLYAAVVHNAARLGLPIDNLPPV